MMTIIVNEYDDDEEEDDDLGDQVGARSQGGQLLPLSKPKAGTACLARSLNVENLVTMFNSSSSTNIYISSVKNLPAHVH